MTDDFNSRLKTVLEQAHPHLCQSRRGQVEELVCQAVSALDGTETEADRHRLLFALACGQDSPSTAQ